MARQTKTPEKRKLVWAIYAASWPLAKSGRRSRLRMVSKPWRTPKPLATPVNDLIFQISGDVISAARLQAKRREPKQIDGEAHSHDPPDPDCWSN